MITLESQAWSLNPSATGHRHKNTEMTSRSILAFRMETLKKKMLAAVPPSSLVLVTMIPWCSRRSSTWSKSTAPNAGRSLPSTSRDGSGSSAANDGTITSTQKSRSLLGLRKRTESSMRPTNGSATAGQRSPSSFLDGTAKHFLSDFCKKKKNVNPDSTAPPQDR